MLSLMRKTIQGPVDTTPEKLENSVAIVKRIKCFRPHYVGKILKRSILDKFEEKPGREVT